MTNNTGLVDGHGEKVINENVSINDSSRNNEIYKNDIQNNQNSTSLQIDHNKELISGILKHFQQLQINIALPEFEPDRSNPVEFIRNFEKYCIPKDIVEHQKVLIVEDALRGSARV